MGMVLTPLAGVVHGSTLAFPSLAPIPDSRMHTPSLTPPDHFEQPPPVPPHPQPQSSSSGESSRRQSAASLLLMPGSYFSNPTSTPFPITTTSTIVDRPRPQPLSIPRSTSEEPLFSSYPDAGPSRSSSRGSSFRLRSSLALTSLTRHRHRRESSTDTSADEGFVTCVEPAPFAQSSDLPSSNRSFKGRRRAQTMIQADRGFGPQVGRDTPPPRALTFTRSFNSFRRRRASMGSSHVPSELDGPDRGQQWSGMPDRDPRRYPPVSFPFSQRGQSDYTLQSVSTITTVRPLASPSISQRRSSLSTSPHDVLGLTYVSPNPTTQAGEILIPDDLVMPHDPPLRRSSLDATGMLRDDQASPNVDSTDRHRHSDAQSLLSSSMTTTEASDALFSPPGSSDRHPLSSATTSLSRSAKSGDEGVEGQDKEKVTDVSVIRLQRSLEWEARQHRHHRRVENRKMVLLELVETEVTYAEDLKTLVQIYLPQLAALPTVSERTTAMVARNASALLDIHQVLAMRMVEVIKEEGLNFDQQAETSTTEKVERAARRVAALFVENADFLGAYKEYCAGSIAAASLVRHISMRSDYEAFERRCQIISSGQPHSSLQDLLNDADPSYHPSNRSRLRFRDFLITPVQRICRYPLLLNQLASSASSPMPDRTDFFDEQEGIGKDVEAALAVMRSVAEDADEARRLKESEIKSSSVISRMDYHPLITPMFLKSLGTCRLVGSLDVLHHHPTLAPLVPPVKVKYLAAFLYRGYLVLAKVKKGKTYEPRHYLPLEVFQLIDITEGFLPHSIRLVLQEHNFDLAASCETEKEVWSAALCAAKEDSVIPPFELPASVSPFTPRSRRTSLASQPEDDDPPSPKTKRHTLAFPPGEMNMAALTTSPINVIDFKATPVSSPLRSSFGFTPDRQGRPGQPSTILLRRPSATRRLLVDRGLMDVFSESCATARSKAQLHQALFLPDMPPSELRDKLAIKESTMLRRRRSFLDARPASFDIAFTGEIRGSVIPVRPSRSAIKRRTLPPEVLLGEPISRETAELDDKDEASEAATSDYGTMRNLHQSTMSRSDSVISFSPAPTPKRSTTSLRAAYTTGGLLNRRKTASAYNLTSRPFHTTRAKSTPNTPRHVPLPPIMFKHPSETSTVLARDSPRSPVQSLNPTANLNTGSSIKTSESSSTWESFRRTMSFRILNRSKGSITSFDETTQDDDPSSIMSSSYEGVSGRKGSTGGSSYQGVSGQKELTTSSFHDGVDGQTGSTAGSSYDGVSGQKGEDSVVDLSENLKESGSSGSLDRGRGWKWEKEKEVGKDEDGLFTTPKRKRLFGSLSRFTPI
ncbi:hypothetical protein M231_04313 [Tremella mesenterica]|uniref:DH domain-containing protein n=1 Tax=Tremella mesenterica TaxID=5217 RepID=A0A4Q1BKX8_TREME|nr:uncharacterized protein TREMEDRAFT_72967 [Tremella mesenterica DSM 1558]EIW73040.1 hypothetical protein TREMEDRAFT_72967 [Tremella mesenterica DSM 1558]RXK38404.1 hypothetical protein M231_04313 [Tremella mesenterica]